MEPAILMRSLLVVAVALVALASCKANPAYCEGEPGNRCCTRDSDCAANDPERAVCDLDTGSCGPCADPDLASCGAAPVDCAAMCPESHVCKAAGGCAPVSEVAYVAGGGAGDCSQARPCGTLAEAVATRRPYILITGSVMEPTTVTIADSVEISGAAHATIQPADAAASLLVIKASLLSGKTITISDLDVGHVKTAMLYEGAIKVDMGDPRITLTRVTVHDNAGVGISLFGSRSALTIANSVITGNHGSGVEIWGGGAITISETRLTSNDGGGIAGVASPDTLTIDRCTIDSNAGGGIRYDGSNDVVITRSTIAHNPGGGVYLTDGTFTVVGNYIVNNTTTRTDVGGVYLGEDAVGNFEFNTVVDNQSGATSGAGIRCADGSTATLRNNIVFDTRPGSGGIPDLISDSCDYSYTLLRQGAGTGAGASNKYVDDARFVDSIGGNYHLERGSPAIRAADPAAALVDAAIRVDSDGDVRTAPADLGADQVP
jgi:hypothetical protein